MYQLLVQLLQPHPILMLLSAWLLFRLSGTEPVARVYGEACSPKDLKNVLDAGKKFVAPGS